MNNRLTAGAFADLCGTTKATLRWYRKIGLLVPKIIGENGYAYYESEQLVEFSIIHALQKVGYSLEQIKTYKNFDGKDDTDFLNQQIKQLDQEIKVLQNQRDFLIQLNTVQDRLAAEWGKYPVAGITKIRHEKAAKYLIIIAPISDLDYYQAQLAKLQKLIKDLRLGEDETIITYVDTPTTDANQLADDLCVGIKIQNQESEDKLAEVLNDADSEMKVVVRPAGDYSVYLTSFLLEADPNQLKYEPSAVNPLIVGQRAALKVAEDQGYRLTGSLLETPLTVLKQADGLKHLFLEVSVLVEK